MSVSSKALSDSGSAVWSRSGRWIALCLLSLLAGCAGTYKPANQPITRVDEDSGYRRVIVDRNELLGDSLILLAFSGGGTRAAALSYGVMQELRDTLIDNEGVEIRLLDEVDSISSVSGGSFTAAYYGVFRDKLFEDYEEVFLRQSVQSTLIRRLFNPVYWVRSATDGFDRTEMAIDYYDKAIFKGATFNDMAQNGPPFIDINATDLTSGLRFTFSQDLFDLMCSDLGTLKVARAVTASSAVPVAFPTVVLKNYADQCDITGTRNWSILEQTEIQGEAQEQLVEGLKSYRDVEQRKYIHLVDGGIADNLGLRAMIDRTEGLNELRFQWLKEHAVKNLVIILVNAAVRPDSFIEQSPSKPKPATTMGAFLDAQMSRYNQETVDRLRLNIEQLAQKARNEALPLQIYFSEVSFDHVQFKDASSMLNNMPTSLELSDREVDQLIASGRMLLRHEPSFTRFRMRNNARLAEGAMTEESVCEFYQHPKCGDAETE